MVRAPWRSQSGDENQVAEAAEDAPDEDPIVSCDCQDGTIVVYEDAVHIERASPSTFEDKRIPMAEISDVVFAKRLFINYVQIEQLNVDNSEGSLLSTPVGENTVHFGRGKRGCIGRARDAILERIAHA